VRRAAAEFESMTLPAGARRRGLIVARQQSGIELIVGARRDASFGAVVLVGLGGVLAEALDDVIVGLAPLERDEAIAMLRGRRGPRNLHGRRRGSHGQ